MKKIILLTIIPLAMLMADFTLIGEQLTTTTPSTTEPTTTSSAKTNWGFQPFTVPADSITVNVGDDLQAAINSLPNGGTVTLSAGTHYVNDVRFKSNIVLKGMGIDNTLLKFDTSGSANRALLHAVTVDNLIIKDMKVDCTGNGTANGIEINVGCNNVLVENIEVFNAGKTNLIIYNYNRSGEGKNITYRNIKSYNPGIHGMSMRYVTGAIIENSEAYGSSIEYGIDLSNVIYGEIANCNSHNNAYGTKFPASTYMYIHDTVIQDNAKVGIQFNRIDNANPSAYFHIENVSIINSAGSAVDWGDTLIRPTFQEFVTIGNTFQSNTYNYFRLGGVTEGHEYGDNIGLLNNRLTTDVVNITTHETSTPAQDNVGYTSWPNFN